MSLTNWVNYFECIYYGNELCMVGVLLTNIIRVDLYIILNFHFKLRPQTEWQLALL